MTDTAKPDVQDYRVTLYCGSSDAGLAGGPEAPIALYADKVLALAHGAILWPSTFKVVDLSEADQ